MKILWQQQVENAPPRAECPRSATAPGARTNMVFLFFSLLVNTHVRDGGGKQHRFGGSQFCCAGTLYEDYKAVTLGTVNWTQTFIKKKDSFIPFSRFWFPTVTLQLSPFQAVINL